jgi:hypothetical protein
MIEAAARQAREALKTIAFYGPDMPWHDSVRAAIDAAMAPSEKAT